MSYKDFIEKFVESSSLSEKDSKLLALEMESDFYAKEKDLILNNENEIMKKIEDDFGDKDKLAKEMFLAHHKYLNIPILGPMLFFKSFRIGLVLALLIPINIYVAIYLARYTTDFIDLLGIDQSNAFIYYLRFLPGFIIPYLVLSFAFAYLKLKNMYIKKGSIILFFLTLIFLLIIFSQNIFLIQSYNYNNNFELIGVIAQLLWLVLLLVLCLLILNLLTILFKKVFKWTR